ncbi:MAG: alpha/beta hydrolase [Sphingopyxis sp.]|nr:alpha/beta hydrolase [Sphingopyxis sp.]
MKRYGKGLIVAGALLGTGVASCADGKDSASATEIACPPTPPPPGMPSMPPIPMATSIKPSDTSSSTMIKPDPADQIKCGRTEIRNFDNVIFTEVPAPGGGNRPLALDMIKPAKSGRYPLVIYITGGGFVIAPKENGLNLRRFVAEQGFVVASVQYRTAMDGANYRDGIADVKAAIRYLRAHADDYGIDPAHVSVWGESAGGYLAAMVGLTNGQKDFDQGSNADQSSAVEAVIDKFGTSDTSGVAEDFNPEMAMFAAPGSPIARYMTEGGQTFPPASNALTHVGADSPRFLIFHGSQDRIVSPSQTLKLHEALRAAGRQSTRYVLDGAGHGDLAFAGDPAAGLPWSTNEAMDIIVRFLRESK